MLEILEPYHCVKIISFWWEYLKLYNCVPALVGGLSLNSDDSESPQISWTLLNIPADLDNTVDWMFSSLPLISNSFSIFSSLWGHSKCTNYNWYHRHSHLPYLFFVLRQGPNICLFFGFLLSSLCGLPERQNQLGGKFFFFLLFNSLFGILAGIERSVCISKSQKALCVSFSWTDSGLCMYHLVVWSNFNFSHNF